MPITALYGALVTLLVVVLGFRVSLGRMNRFEAEPLRHRVRVHGNLIESAPLFVVMLGVCELGQAPALLLHGLGAGFVVARLAHAFGLSQSFGRTAPRFFGTAASWTILSVLAGVAVWSHWVD